MTTYRTLCGFSTKNYQRYVSHTRFCGFCALFEVKKKEVVYGGYNGTRQ